jgi:16S rRNA processing protein RimM
LIAAERRLPVGRIGRAHGRDGSFYVNGPDSDFEVGSEVSVGGVATTVERRAGTDAKPLIRLTGIDPREHAGERILADVPLGEGEYDAQDLVGCRVEGVGTVERVVNGPSCDVLEVGDVLIPFVEDAIVRLDLDARVIEVDRSFLGL